MDLVRDFLDTLLTEPVLDALSFLSTWAPLWVPILLLFGFWRLWIRYIRAHFISEMDWVFLEVLLPEEVPRSPLAMELFLNVLQMSFGESGYLEVYWKGGVRPWTSLELISIEGDVHFIIRAHKGSKNLIESQIYAQYPDAEVVEVPDYTQGVTFDQEAMAMWGCEFALTKDDPYPIKTYVDYNLDTETKEEQKVDPITPALEWLGSLGKGEQGWIQILVRQHKKENYEPRNFLKGKFFRKKIDKWKEDAKAEIKKIKEDAKVGGDDDNERLALTPGQRDTIAALERSISKLAFDVGIRGIYLAEKDVFSPANIGGLIGSFRNYNTNDLNGFKPTNTTGVDDPWLDPLGWRVPRMKRRMIDAYKRRSYFHPPYKRPHFILNTEELATIYHFPGRIATTPTFKRIPSRKAEPPSDLPR